jgi:CysZ protein
MSNVLLTVHAYLSSLGYLFRPKYFKYILFSGLLSLAFYCLALVVLWYGSDALTDLFTDKISNDRLRSIMDVVTNIISFLGLGLVLLILYKHIVLVLVSPLMSKVSEMVEEEKLGYMPNAKIGTAAGIARGLRIALRNVSKELLLTLLLLLLSVIIPPLTLVTTPLILIIQAYFAGFGNIDVYLGRYLNYSGSVAYLKSHRSLAVANGAVFLMLLLIPILGAFLAPFMSTVAATLVISKQNLVD